MEKLPPLVLRTFQTDAVQRGLQQHSYYAFDPGLGKTVTAIETGRALRDALNTPTRNLVVLSPKATIEQWAETIMRQDREAVPIDMTSTVGWWYASEASKRGDPIWIITHYQFLAANVRFFQKQGWHLIVADEAHFVNNRNAKRTEALKSLEAVRKIAMSATFQEKTAADIWSVLNWFDRHEYSSYWSFAEKYCNIADGRNGTRIPESTKKAMYPELGRELRRWMIRVTKQQAAPHMPPLQENYIPVRLDPAQQKVYDKINDADDILVEIEQAGGNVDLIITSQIARITRLMQVVSFPPTIGLDVPSSKMEWAIAYAKNNPKEQMIFFSRFRKTALHLAEQLGAAFVVGGRDPHKLREFRQGKVQCLVGTIDGMGTGLDFPAVRIATFIDQHWSTIQMTQAKERHYRLGAYEREKKIVNYLMAHGTVDYLVKLALTSKWGDRALVENYLKDKGLSDAIDFQEAAGTDPA